MRWIVRRKHWGWGYEHEQPSYTEVRSAAAFISYRDVVRAFPRPLRSPA